MVQFGEVQVYRCVLAKHRRHNFFPKIVERNDTFSFKPKSSIDWCLRYHARGSLNYSTYYLTGKWDMVRELRNSSTIDG